TVWLAGFGVQADTLAVVPSLVWDDTTYTFQQPEVDECAVIDDGGDASNLDSGDWTFGLTRSEGHVEFVEDGLRLWTDSWSSEAKAAAEYLVDVPLGELGEPELDVTAQSGTIPPGIHLGVDFDDDGTVDGFLIGETAYEGKWWFDYGAQFVRDG